MNYEMKQQRFSCWRLLHSSFAWIMSGHHQKDFFGNNFFYWHFKAIINNLNKNDNYLFVKEAVRPLLSRVHDYALIIWAFIVAFNTYTRNKQKIHSKYGIENFMFKRILNAFYVKFQVIFFGTGDFLRMKW